jgi:hypothetical protein
MVVSPIAGRAHARRGVSAVAEAKTIVTEVK